MTVLPTSNGDCLQSQWGSLSMDQCSFRRYASIAGSLPSADSLASLASIAVLHHGALGGATNPVIPSGVAPELDGDGGHIPLMP